MKNLTLLIKPVSGRCNLRCRYCFYRELETRLPHQSGAVMSAAVLETLVAKAMAEATGSVAFAFQGGEPTLAGIGFYREFLDLLRKYGRKDIRTELSIQTNGILLNEEWAVFLRENKFLVGLSLDGDADLNDNCRITPAGQGTFKMIAKSLQLLQKHQVEYNILCVVTRQTARHAGSLYRFFKKNNCRYLQFIPCLDPLANERGQEHYSLPPDRYGAFLCTLFDLWYADYAAQDYTSIRLFDDWVHSLAGMPTGSCTTSGRCGGYLVVEADGSVYPCDFYVLEEWLLGNILEHSFSELADSPRALAFKNVSRQLPNQCPDCQYLAVCRGGCRRDRILSPDGQVLDNYYCASFQMFFDHAYPGLARIADRERRSVQ